MSQHSRLAIMGKRARLETNPFRDIGGADDDIRAAAGKTLKEYVLGKYTSGHPGM
jgi:hypothetical protein